MHPRLVPNVPHSAVSLLRTAAVALLASLGLPACDEPAPTLPTQHTESPDGGTGGPALVSQVTVQVAGLEGAALVVRVGHDEDYQINANGLHPITLKTALDDVRLDVLQQPEQPAQTCEVHKLDRTTFALTCVTPRYQVTGTVEGYEGSGLVLVDQSGERLAVQSNGAFTFSTPLAVGAAFEVLAEGEVTAPRQTCAVSGGSGKISTQVQAPLTVTCATKTYYIRAQVSGLTESGLQLELPDGSILSVPEAGVFKYPSPLPDGFPFDVRVHQQPTTGSQRCHVQDGEGKIDGSDEEILVSCDVLGGLRISEVGSCPYSNSSCWVELVNANANGLPEQLGFYSLRTMAISPTGVETEHVFKLPEVTIPYRGVVVVQARTSSALPDGNNVLHVSDGSIVPWWNSAGFVEILHARDGSDDAEDITTDFVRFGNNDMQPRTGGAWMGGTAASLPTGARGYGYALVHTPKVLSVNAPEYWDMHAFATPGGANDVIDDVDADSDGIPDSAEIPGGSYAGIDVYALGARLGRKDVFVEVDHMESKDPAVLPRREALDKLVEVFGKRGISVHFDVGDLYSASFNPAAYNLGGGNPVPFSKGIGFGPQGSGLADLYAIKAAHMAAARRPFFYYQLFAWSQQADGSGGSSGIGELPGNDSIITLGGFGLKTITAPHTNLVINYQAATMMHELGHNLGLRHGGGDSLNRKPNYVSVMNYLYSPLGLPTIGNVEGDRFDLYERCSLFSVAQLTNAPTGAVSKFVLDYSDGLSADLDEGALVEQAGLGRHDSAAVDYDCDGKTHETYSRDVNQDLSLDVLSDHDDWASLSFAFHRMTSGAENGASLRFLNPGLSSDVSTADQHRVTDLPCGAMDPDLFDL